ncbi:MAG: outer membrane lipoprotein-sorting protein [Ignavibacteriaceae bacterium]|nr:outer membrane lipoprotein-sorting protein [Ignavibacteriaceae bacterium]
MIHKIFAIILFISGMVFSQGKNPEEILEKVKLEFEKIEDYQVDVKIKVDVDFLKMPDREATIFYKKPDKFHIDSENFAMLPKSGLNFSPLGFLNYKYTSFYEREDTINGILTSVIKVIPLEGRAEVILSTFWVDIKRNLILKVESSRKPQGEFVIDLAYLKTTENFWLPSSMIFTFTVDESVLPRRFMDDQDSKSNETGKDSTKAKTGKVFLTYSNYRVNAGLPDEIFEDKDAKK